MTVSLTSQATGNFGGTSFNYGFAFDSVANRYYVTHASVDGAGNIVNPASNDTLSLALTALQAIEASVSAEATATAQSAALAGLQAIEATLQAQATAAGQASSLTALQALQASAATATGQANIVTALQAIDTVLAKSANYSDKSGACSATVNSFTLVVAANNARGYLRISNPNTTGTLYVYDKASGTATLLNSIQIAPGKSQVWDNRVPNGPILIAGSVASLAFEGAEGV